MHFWYVYHDAAKGYISIWYQSIIVSADSFSRRANSRCWHSWYGFQYIFPVNPGLVLIYRLLLIDCFKSTLDWPVGLQTSFAIRLCAHIQNENASYCILFSKNKFSTEGKIWLLPRSPRDTLLINYFDPINHQMEGMEMKTSEWFMIIRHLSIIFFTQTYVNFDFS